MHRDDGRWRHGGDIHPSVLSKEEQRGRRCLFIIGLGAGTFSGLRRIFSRISPNFHEVFCATFSYKFSPQRLLRHFLVWPPKKVFMCFSANLGRRFWKSSNVGQHFYADYHGCCQDFQQIKTTFKCALASPAPPPPTPLLFITAS